MNGISLNIGRGVFDPSLHFTSAFMADYIRKSAMFRETASILDVGTGSGILAITAAQGGCKHVVAVDLNPAAVECARLNATRNGVGSLVDVQVGEFVPPQSVTKFDYIICNPPYFRGSPGNLAQRAYFAGPDLEWFDGFIRAAQECLTPVGRVLLVLSDAADLATILSRFSNAGWSYRVVARRDILIEVMFIVELTTGESAKLR